MVLVVVGGGIVLVVTLLLLLLPISRFQSLSFETMFLLSMLLLKPILLLLLLLLLLIGAGAGTGGGVEAFDFPNSSHDTSYHWTLWTLPTSKPPNNSLKAVGAISTSPEGQIGHLSTISTTTELDP